jgi:hypothetical protein
MEEEKDSCPHCDPKHSTPNVSWGVYVADTRDGDGQPTHLIVMKSDGAHVAQEDANWLFKLINNWQPPFVDLCAICGHMINSVIEIEDNKALACEHSSPHLQQSDSWHHMICTYGGCMPDFEYRRDNIVKGNILWDPLRKS